MGEVETRRADPTLSGLAGWVLVSDTTNPNPHAHAFIRHGEPPPCEASLPAGRTVLAEHARWFAVPCRNCFPHVPEPGHGECKLVRDGHAQGCDAPPGHYCRRDPGLAWQVP